MTLLLERAAERRPPHASRRRPTASLGPRFGALWGARTVSSMGDGLALVAFPLLATSLTHDPRLIAGVALATRLPWLVVSLPAGALADRLDRRRLLATVETVRMAVLAALGLAIATRRVDLVELYATAFVLGTCETAFVAATQAVVPEIVPTHQLARANGRLVVSEATGEQFAGPALGGLAFAAAASVPFLADGVSFAASAVLLTRALPRRSSPRGARAHRSPRQTIRRDVAEGLRWLAADHVLRVTAALIASFAFCQALGMAVLVVYGVAVLHLSGPGYGLFVAAAAVGNLLGAGTARRALNRFGTAAVLVAAGILAAAAFAVVGLTSDVVVAAAALAAEAVAVGVGNVATLSLRQARIPGPLAGRVNAAMRMCTLGAASVAALAGGILTSVAGAHAPFLCGGIVQLVAAVGLGTALARHLGWSAAPGGWRRSDDGHTVDITEVGITEADITEADITEGDNTEVDITDAVTAAPVPASAPWVAAAPAGDQRAGAVATLDSDVA